MKLYFLAGWAVLIFATVPLRADLSQKEMNYGYGILHNLCDEETQVDLIMMVKTTPPQVAELAKAISKSAKEDMSILDQLAEHDPALRYDQQGFPEIETETRTSIKDEKQHLLLFGTKGGEFGKTLVLTQIEASTYGENLAKVLAGNESNPHRAAALRHIAASWETIKNKSYTLLYQM